jgi:hypothetical protein
MEMPNQLAEVSTVCAAACKTAIIVQFCDTFQQEYSAVGSNRWFQQDPKHFIIMLKG